PARRAARRARGRAREPRSMARDAARRPLPPGLQVGRLAAARDERSRVRLRGDDARAVRRHARRARRRLALCAPLRGCLDERAEEGAILALLGMPEDADREPPPGILHALERAVVRARRLAQARAERAEALVVVRLRDGARAEDPGEPGSRDDLDPVLPEHARHGTVRLDAERVGQVLLDAAAAGDVEYLRAAADREHRNVAVERGPHQLELELVAL